MGQISAVGIKKIFYGEITDITKPITQDEATKLIKAAKKAGNEVQNVHQDTWNLEESEASVNGYKNQLNGQTYRSETTPGELTPSFSIGQYDYETKAKFMGGKVIKGTASGGDAPVIGWERSNEKVEIFKALYCLTEDDVWFIFPKAQIVSREANTDKAIAIGVKGLVQTPTVNGVSMEYNFDESAIKALVG